MQLKIKRITRICLQMMMLAFPFLFAISCQQEETVIQIPTLITVAINDVTENSATSGGNISSDGGATIISRGVCWNKSGNPIIEDDKTTDGAGSGEFTSILSGLESDETYHLRAYATNSAGTAYGQDANFKTEKKALLNSLLSYWKLDEAEGVLASDELQNWNLSFINNPSWSSSAKINNSIDFGTTSTRHLEKSGVNSGNKNTYTLAAWIYIEESGNDAKNIMGLNSGNATVINAGAAEVKLYLSSTNNLVVSYHTTDGWVGPMLRISGNAVEIQKWHHVAGVINNGDIQIYINGAIDTTNPVQNSISDNLNILNGRVTIGNARLYNGSYIASRWFRGKIDEAAIWSRPLKPEEIEKIYNNGDGLQYPF